MKTILIISLFAFLASNIYSQDFERMERFNKIVNDLGLNELYGKEDYYIKYSLGLIKNEKLFFEQDLQNLYYKLSSSQISFVGDYKRVLNYWDKGYKMEGNSYTYEDSVMFNQYISQNAVNFILKAADSNQVIMINEAHHLPQTRILTTLLLQDLYNKGFRYFAAETLNNGATFEDTVIIERGYPLTTTGFYTMEPIFGDMIRQALKIGFKIIPYEKHYKMPGDREVMQAKNLYEVIENDPEAKIVVHCGYDHVKPDWMAGEFQRISGINPLTIDQTTMMEYSKVEYSNPFYQLALRGKMNDFPVVFSDSSGNANLNYKAYDIVIFNPPTIETANRPEWMSMLGYRKPYRIDNNLLTDTSLVQAFVKGENMEIAVPMDQVMVWDSKQQYNLYLPKGNYNLRIWDKNYKIVYSEQINIK